MPKEKSPAIKKKLAKKGLSQLNRECSLDAFKHNLRREYHAGQTAQGTQHVAIALSVLKRSCGVDSKDRMTPKEIVAAGGKRESMNMESINSILVKAIGQIQQQELSSVVEARTKKEQAAIDKATLKKHGVKFRSTDDGGVLAVTKQGDIVSDEPPAKTKGKSPAKKKTKTSKQQAATAKKHIDKMLAKKGLEAEVGPQGDGQFVVKIGKKGEKYQPVKWSIDTSSKKYPVVETESGGYGYDTFKTAQKLKKELIKNPKMFE